MVINPKYKISQNNEFLDLSQTAVRFNIDHLYKLPGTSRSLVFFPYYINVDEVDEFNKYCKSKNYKIIFVGGKSVYGGNTYDNTPDNLRGTNGTMTILLIHADDVSDPPSKFLRELDGLTIPN
tara:strand:- start:140 stop:508 length:369 start_codon:yes stop_codon:yes gene_type:complete